MKVLVTGAAGPRGQKLALALASRGDHVVGVDRDGWAPPAGSRVRFERVDHTKRGFDELMRQERFDAVCHLAVHAGFRLANAERHRMNLEGSKRVIDLSAAHGVEKLLVASNASVYGALPDNPCFMTEDAPPSVGRTFPEMQDVVAADLLALAAMWRHPAMEIVVLRPVHCLGPTSRDTLAALLRRRYVPVCLGYNPMIQVIHEEDLARAFATALTPGLRGVFNVTGPGEVPLAVLVRESGASTIPLPAALARAMLGRFGLPDVGAGVLDFLKYPCLVDGARFAAATGFTPEQDLTTTVRSVRAMQPTQA